MKVASFVFYEFALYGVFIVGVVNCPPQGRKRQEGVFLGDLEGVVKY